MTETVGDKLRRLFISERANEITMNEVKALQEIYKKGPFNKQPRKCYE